MNDTAKIHLSHVLSPLGLLAALLVGSCALLLCAAPAGAVSFAGAPGSPIAGESHRF